MGCGGDEYAFDGDFVPFVVVGIEDIYAQQFEGLDAENARGSGFQLR